MNSMSQVAPTFSVIIPTYNRPAALSHCLAALTELDYPRERLEVIVVNDGGRSIDDVAAPFAGKIEVAHITVPNAGPAKARNAGVARARGKFIAFTDDDCRPDPAWLTELERQLAADEDVLVGGRVVNSLEANACSAASQLLVTYLYMYYNSNRDRSLFFTSNNMAMSRAAFLNAGGFDDRYPRAAAEDRELCDRWTHLGRRMVYAEAALVRHFHNLTLGSFWRQHFHYGQGAMRYRQARALRAAGPVRVEPFGFYTGLLSYPWAARAPHALKLATLLFIAQAANAIGFFWEKLFGAPAPLAGNRLSTSGALQTTVATSSVGEK